MNEYAQDAFRNLVSGKGLTGRDRSIGNMWDVSYLHDRSTIENAYATDWVARQVVDVPAEEVRRKWRSITTPSMTPDEQKKFIAFERSLGVRDVIVRAIRWARMYGGGGVFIAIDSAVNEEPINIDSVKRGARVSLIDFDRDEVTPENVQTDMLNANFGLPKQYRTVSSQKVVDESRMLRFDGFDLPRRVRETNQSWGGSILLSSLSAIERCETVSAALAQLVEEANIDVISVPDLFGKLSKVESAAALRARFAEGDIVKSLYRLMLLDSKEEYNRHELSGSLAGLVSMLTAFYNLPAAASGIPVTKLLGISPGGLNATGESDLENYYDLIDTIRSGPVAAALEIIDSVICRILFGKIFPDWSYEWASLWQEDQTGKAEIRSKRIASLVQLMQAGTLTASQVIRQLLDEGVVTSVDDDYIETLEEIEGMGEDGESDADVGNVAVVSGADVQKEALNGAQIAQLASIASQVARGELLRSQAIGVARMAFPAASIDEIENAIGSQDEIDRLQAKRAKLDQTGQRGE